MPGNLGIYIIFHGHELVVTCSYARKNWYRQSTRPRGMNFIFKNSFKLHRDIKLFTARPRRAEISKDFQSEK